MGEPVRAKTCACNELQRLDADGLCVHCGYWPRETVDATWTAQAKRTGFSGNVSDLEQDRRRLFSNKAAA